MKGIPPFQGEPGQPLPPSADPIKLLNWCISHGVPIQLVNFNGGVQGIEFKKKHPPSGTCFHRPSGEVQLRGSLCSLCGENHGGPNERCAACGEMIPYHEFPGREPRVAHITIEAPVRVGENLQGPPGEQDFLFIVHIPRMAADLCDSPIERPTIIMPGQGRPI